MESIMEVFAYSSMMNMFSALISVVGYVLGSLGLYTIAQRRGIRNPWLSWVPVGNVWILGCISDQYQKVAKGRDHSRRKVLMWLYVAVIIALVLIIGLAVGLVIDAIELSEAESYYYDYDYYDSYEYSAGVGSVVSGVLGILLFTLVMVVVSIVYSVFVYMAYYDLYASCNPSNAAVFLVLSILFSFLGSVFVFACRNKDEGMRPEYRPVMPYNYPPQGGQPPYGQGGYYPPQQSPAGSYPPAPPYQQAGYRQPPAGNYPPAPYQQPPVQPNQPPVQPVQPVQPPVQPQVQPEQPPVQPVQQYEQPARPSEETNE